MTEQALHESIRQMTEGSKEAFRIVYDQSKEEVFRTVSLLVNNKQDVNDVVNEVYMELCKSLSKYDFNKPFRSWLTGLTIRQVHNWNRKLWRRFRLHERSVRMELHEPSVDAESLYLRNEHRSELIQLVQGLNYKHRCVIVLRYYHEYSFEEIAELLGIPVGTVKSRHHTALNKLRQQSTNPITDDEGGFSTCPSKIN
ncbi:sigma-70 family RNA polymerase sigma factor [Paenibacillus sp. UNC451MF]|uniref:sigma-70 family RNA polymerase sigma factor n=1 Tax=Paenibacillus sp. UNC451MF TaxID=1449063 RepID=UPI00048EEFBC|nr:sigma-70 family RNA polymerase sigma factor [Paenibacillus sp. UNC451MF]